MDKERRLSEAELSILSKFSTPSICNAVEEFNLRPRSEGYIKTDILPLFPELGPMVGYAVTARSSACGAPTPEQRNLRYALLELLQNMTGPKIVVIEDTDSPACLGSFWGEIQANLHRRLGCIGTVTNGGVRDIDEVRKLGFHFFANRAVPSRAYVHLVDIGRPITLGGMMIKTGDLLHGDKHGITNIPNSIAGDIADTVGRIEDRERRIIDYCRSDDFNIEGLKALYESKTT